MKGEKNNKSYLTTALQIDMIIVQMFYMRVAACGKEVAQMIERTTPADRTGLLTALLRNSDDPEDDIKFILSCLAVFSDDPAARTESHPAHRPEPPGTHSKAAAPARLTSQNRIPRTP